MQLESGREIDITRRPSKTLCQRAIHFKMAKIGDAKNLKQTFGYNGVKLIWNSLSTNIHKDS